jgi:hypothetical protein
MFFTGLAIFTGAALLLAKLRRRWMLRALDHDGDFSTGAAAPPAVGASLFVSWSGRQPQIVPALDGLSSATTCRWRTAASAQPGATLPLMLSRSAWSRRVRVRVRRRGTTAGIRSPVGYARPGRRG